MLFIFYYPNGGVETLARQRNLALKPFAIHFDYLYLMKGPGLQNIHDGSHVYITSNNDEMKQIITDGGYEAIIICSDYQKLETIREFGYSGVLIYEVQGLGNLIDTEYWLSNLSKPYIDQHADAILAPLTPHLQDFLKQYYPDKPKYHFHNGLDIHQFKPNDQLRVDENPIVAWVGRIEANKNWKEFIEVSKRLTFTHSSLQFWMFLDGIQYEEKEMEEFRLLLKDDPFFEKITLYYDIPHAEMPNYYSTIAKSNGFLCSTSINEGFGYALLEAMSTGCPVLTSNSDGITSFVFHNHTGKMYKQGNIDEAVVQAKDILDNTLLREQLIENAINHVHSYFSLEQYGRNFIQMIEELKNNQSELH